MKQRVRWLDRCKGFAAIMVVTGHIADGYLRADMFTEYSALIRSVYYLLYSFHMPLFFILSGYAFALAYGKEGVLKKDRVRLQLINIVYQYFLFSAVQWIFKRVFSSSVNNGVELADLLMLPIKPMAPYWYLYSMAFFYLFALILDKTGKLNSKFLLYASILVSFAVSGIPISVVFPLKDILYNFAFFYIGYYFMRRNIESRLTWKHGGCLIAAAVGMLICAYVKQADLRSLHIIGFIGPLVIALAIIFIIQRIPDFPKTGIFELCGTYALEIYVVHCFITAGNRVILPKLGISNFALSFVINAVMAIFIPIGLALLLKKLNMHKFIFRPAACFSEKRKTAAIEGERQ